MKRSMLMKGNRYRHIKGINSLLFCIKQVINYLKLLWLSTLCELMPFFLEWSCCNNLRVQYEYCYKFLQSCTERSLHFTYFLVQFTFSEAYRCTPPNFQHVAHLNTETNKALSTAFTTEAFHYNNNKHFTAVHTCTQLPNVGGVYVDELMLF